MKPTPKVEPTLRLYGLVRRDGAWSLITATVRGDRVESVTHGEPNFRRIVLQGLADILETTE
jgi:hypothetical protein